MLIPTDSGTYVSNLQEACWTYLTYDVGNTPRVDRYARQLLKRTLDDAFKASECASLREWAYERLKLGESGRKLLERLMGGETGASLDQLDKLAKALRKTPAELLSPGGHIVARDLAEDRLLDLFRQLPAEGRDALLTEAERLRVSGPWCREALWLARDIQRLPESARSSAYSDVQDALVNLGIAIPEGTEEEHEAPPPAPSPSAPAETKPRKRPSQSRR